METLQDFVNLKNVILIGSYYDDRSNIDGEKNQEFRKNVCTVFLPNRSPEKTIKLNKTSFEGDFLDEPDDDEKRILRFYWQVNDHKLCLQIFICGDFLNHIDKIDRKHGGILIVPACSPKVEEFKGISEWCIRPYEDSKTERCVFICNAVSLPKQQTKLRIIGSSQIFGPYQGSLPMLGTDVEKGMIATIRGQNVITKPSAIPSGYNIVIENPISFCLQEKNGKLEVWEDIQVPPKKVKWAINPNIFNSLGLNTYLTFAKLKSYYSFRPVLKESFTQCVGIMGSDDLIAMSLAEEESDALMYIYSGRSDLASSFISQHPMPLYFKATHYLKYRGYALPPSVTASKEEIENYREYLYQLAEGINVEKIDGTVLNELKDNNLILGKEKNIFDPEEGKSRKMGEFVVGIFLPARNILDGDNSCKIFDSECVHKHLLENPNVTDIFFSEAGAGGRGAINLHYILRVIGDIQSIRDLILDSIHKPLSKNEIEFGTRVMPIVDYLSDLEFEALLETYIGDPAKRRVLREIIVKTGYRLDRDGLLIRRLSTRDINNLIKIYKFRERASVVLHLDKHNISDMIAGFFHGWVLAKVKQPKDDKHFNIIYDNIRGLYTSLAEKAEGILSKNLNEKRDRVGEEEFDETVSKIAKKQIKIKPELNPLIIATSIWNTNRKDDIIINEEYTLYVKKLQGAKVSDIRNHFSHHSKFLKSPQHVKSDMDKTVNALLSLMEFVDKFTVNR